MQTRIYQLYAGLTLPFAAGVAAQVQIRNPGQIIGVTWNVADTGNVDMASVAIFELSLTSSNQLATNDGFGVVSAIAYAQGLNTSGFSISCANLYVSGLQVPVGAGNILFLNASVPAGGPQFIKALVSVLER